MTLNLICLSFLYLFYHIPSFFSLLCLFLSIVLLLVLLSTAHWLQRASDELCSRFSLPNSFPFALSFRLDDCCGRRNQWCRGNTSMWVAEGQFTPPIPSLAPLSASRPSSSAFTLHDDIGIGNGCWYAL